MSFIATKDGTQIYYKDWGRGQAVVFSHGWPLSADAWEDQMIFLAEKGYRCIAHDRRGHGRSGQPWNGNDMDTYADDLAELCHHLDLKGAQMDGTLTIPKALINPGFVPMLYIDGIKTDITVTQDSTNYCIRYVAIFSTHSAVLSFVEPGGNGTTTTTGAMGTTTIASSTSSITTSTVSSQ